MYCEKPDHKSSDCKTAKTVTERKKILSYKKLYFNCKGLNTGPQNVIALNLIHLSICGKLADSKCEPMLVTAGTNTTYPVAIIKVNGVKCRVLLDRGSGSSYIPESFIDPLKINSGRKEYKTIKILTTPTLKNLKYVTYTV